MCTTCLLISAVMLFTPAEKGVQSNHANQISLAQETQVSITELVKQLPNSSDTSLLREGLLSLRSRLSTARNDDHAQEIINDEVASLSQRLSVDHTADEVTEILEALLIEDGDTPLVKRLIKGSSGLPVTPKLQEKSWGWLR